jgi:molybdenum cofactor synthesis domain-containing protein
MLRAEIIAIGSELLTPFRMDTNSLFITRSLEENGIRLIAKTIVHDDETEIARAFQFACSRSDIIICCGGLGPTVDDLTREALSNFLNVDLKLDEKVLDSIRERFRSRGMKMPEANKKQAMVPAGGTILDNPLGSAPGLYAEAHGKQIFLLPGPPHEMEAMWNNQVLPRMRKGEPLERTIFKVAMLGESRVDEMLRPVTRVLQQTHYTILAAAADIEIHLTAPVSARSERQPQKSHAYLADTSTRTKSVSSKKLYQS